MKRTIFPLLRMLEQKLLNPNAKDEKISSILFKKSEKGTSRSDINEYFKLNYKNL